MEKVQHPRGRFGTDRGRHSNRPEVRTVEHDGKHSPVRHLSDGIRSAGAARHRQRDPQCDRGTGRFGRHHAGQACARHPRGWHERTVLRQGQRCGRAHCRHDQSRHGHHVQADADRGKQGRDHAEKAQGPDDQRKVRRDHPPVGLLRPAREQGVDRGAQVCGGHAAVHRRDRRAARRALHRDD